MKMLGGEEDKAVLLVEDAVYYATTLMVKKFKDIGVEEIYVAKDALEARDVELAPDAEVLDYDEMASLIMDDYDQVLSIWEKLS